MMKNKENRLLSHFLRKEKLNFTLSANFFNARFLGSLKLSFFFFSNAFYTDQSLLRDDKWLNIEGRDLWLREGFW
jgi:hypothetical protein